jgi:glycosyltransferase involved in cell wall biosynthesis
MRVLLINNQLQFGGPETVVHQLRSRIPNTRLLVPETPYSCPEVMYPRLLSRLNHSRLHNATEKWFSMFKRTDRRMAKLRRDPADIIHLHNFHGDHASIETLAGLIRAKRVVWTFHGLWGVTGGCDHPKGCPGFLQRCGNCSNWAIAQLQKGFRTRDLGYIAERNELAQLYGESHILLFASPAENFPCVVLEAMASGCCVVATLSGGVVEQLTEGETGFLASGISGCALADALDRAVSPSRRNDCRVSLFR